jgi:Ca-activated chloride channel family protein
MKRTRLSVLELLELGAGDRFGLIPFAGSAFLQCPLTVDQEALRQHVNLVNVDLIPQGGTKIGEAIGEAMKAFAKHEQESHKVLVLFSDGEDHDDEAVEKAREAAESGMRIFTIGTGTPEGDLIPTVTCGSCQAPNVPGRNRCHDCEAYLSADKEFMRDDEGQIVRSRLNEEMLEEIAEITGGFYMRLQGPRTMEILHKNGLAPLPKSENNNAMVRRQIERFQYPLAAAILLLLIELLWPAGRRRGKSHRRHGGVVVAGAALRRTGREPEACSFELQSGRVCVGAGGVRRIAQGKPRRPEAALQRGLGGVPSGQAPGGRQTFPSRPAHARFEAAATRLL